MLVDLYRVVSIADVAIRFERAYARSSKGAMRGKVEEFLQTHRPRPLARRLRDQREAPARPAGVDPLPALHALLDLPLRLEEGGGYRALIALDEFQDVTKMPGPRRADPQPHPVPGEVA